jgi:hypothetical protein
MKECYYPTPYAILDVRIGRFVSSGMKARTRPDVTPVFKLDECSREFSLITHRIVFVQFILESCCSLFSLVQLEECK